MTYLSLTDHPNGVAIEALNRVVYDVAANTAHFGGGSVAGHALVFHVDDAPAADPVLSVELGFTPSPGWLIRCDRIDFPPGGIAYQHTHPGPGIRCQLFGEISITSVGQTTSYGPMQAWFESGPDPVYAAASTTETSAFVRLLVLPGEWAGARTIRYVDPADEDKPKLQKATVFGEELLVRS